MDMEMSEPTETTSIESSPMGAFIQFARYQSEDMWDISHFGRVVRIGLAGEPLAQRSAEALKDPDAWALDKKPYWRGYAGPFSNLTILRAHTGELAVTKGPHRRCADPRPMRVQKALRRYEHWSIQPAEVGSCGAWFSVDVGQRAGVIVGVTLDLYEV